MLPNMAYWELLGLVGAFWGILQFQGLRPFELEPLCCRVVGLDSPQQPRSRVRFSKVWGGGGGGWDQNTLQL